MRLIKGNIRQFGMIIALVFIASLFQILTNGVLLRPGNVVNLVLQNSYILILAIGMMLVIITGRVDLSVGSLVAFTSALSGIFIIRMNWPVWVAIIVVLLVGALSGAWNGFWIAYKNIPFFVVTLGGMMVFRGLTMTVLAGQTLSPFPAYFHDLAAGFLPNIGGGTAVNITAIVAAVVAIAGYLFVEVRNRRNSQKYLVTVSSTSIFIAKITVVSAVIAVFGYWFAMSRGVPKVMILLIILIVGYSFVTNKATIGRHIYATGGDAKAAELSGVKVKQVVFWVYVNMGVLAALAGLVFAARLNAATPRAEAGFELQAIAASFIGGAGAYGGVGKITGAIIGALVMGILNNGLSHLGVGADIQLGITGGVLLLAIIFDVFAKRSKA